MRWPVEDPVKAIEFANLRKAFPGGFALRGVTFDVREGDIFAYLGPNGSGKTTTARLLLGVLGPDGGSARFMDGGRPLARNRIGFTLEDERPFEHLTPLEYLQFVGEVKNLGLPIGRYLETLDWLKIEGGGRKPCGALSKGTQRKLCLAKSIVGDPDVLVLDEPLDGIEPETRREIRDFLVSRARSSRIVFITSHNLYEIESFCTDFGIILNGSLLGRWKMEELRERHLSLEEFYLEKTRSHGKGICSR
jgi:ABC-2 type transport system ATP-binding protein